MTVYVAPGQVDSIDEPDALIERQTTTRRETFRFEFQLRATVQSGVKERVVVALNAAVGCDDVRTSDGPSKRGTKETTRPDTTSAMPRITRMGRTGRSPEATP